MSKFMNIQEALEQRVRYLRKPFWAMPDDHLELPLLEKGFGPWAILHSPQACRDELKSQSILIFSLLNDADTDWEPYQVKDSNGGGSHRRPIASCVLNAGILT